MASRHQAGVAVAQQASHPLMPNRTCCDRDRLAHGRTHGEPGTVENILVEGGDVDQILRLQHMVWVTPFIAAAVREQQVVTVVVQETAARKQLSTF